MKYCCERFRSAIKDHEIKENRYLSDYVYSLCAVEGIESRIHYCPWCGKSLN